MDATLGGGDRHVRELDSRGAQRAPSHARTAPAGRAHHSLAGESGMASLLLLIPLGLALLGVAVWAFFWATDHGQFDDLDTPALRILHDDEITADESAVDASQKKNP